MAGNTVLACFIGKLIIFLSSKRRDRLERHSGCFAYKKIVKDMAHTGKVKLMLAYPL